METNYDDPDFLADEPSIHRGMTALARERAVEKIRTKLQGLPKAQAAVVASSLYTKQRLQQHDSLFRRDLARMLSQMFENTAAKGLSYWKELS